ncbi:MAG TPA: WS/DGAT domain-containing protein [Myxococcales bacterium]|nr:WS/DGAT domain-containing protein [Myxococcales bacterium]
MTLAREQMSAADAAWLQMDAPENRMIITSLMEYEGRIEPAKLELHLQKLAGSPRFRRRVVLPLTPILLPSWEDDPRFDLHAHIHHVGLPPPGSDEDLQRFVGERMSTGLSFEKPLWEIDVIDRPGSGTAILLRVHHCVGDGVALIKLLLSLAEESVAAPRAVGRAPEPPRGPIAWVGEQLSRAKTFVELLALPPDPHTFRTGLGLVKRAAWSAPIRLAAIEELAHREKATVNDVLMAALAGSLRSALERTGALPSREVRALVPLYLRGRADAGNNFGLVYVTLPVGESTREGRICALKQRMAAVKATPTGPVAFEILRAFGVAGAAIERLGVGIFTSKASIMVTNVPGPKARVRIAGQPLQSMMTWAPTSGRLALSATLISYAGELRIGVAGDAHLAVDPAELVKGFEQELAAEAPEAVAAVH